MVEIKLALMFVVSTLICCAPVLANSSLVSYWHLDDISGGRAMDSSGQGNVGAVSGSSAVVSGKVGQGIYFGSPGDDINCGNSSSLMPDRITVACWVKFDDLNTDKMLLEKFQWLGSGYYIKYDKSGGNLYAEIFDSSPTVRKTVSFPGISTGDWYFIAFIADGSTLTSYVNGRKCQSVGAGSIASNSLPLFLGDPAYAGFSLDEVRIYNNALPPAAIRSIWENERRSYVFDGKISRDVLDSYLSRAVTSSESLSQSVSDTEFREDLRLYANTGAKFIGRASLLWGTPSQIDAHFDLAAQRAAVVHAQDPNIIIQGAILECIDTNIGNVPVPAWVFEAFDLPVQNRNFNYSAMLFPDGRFVNHWWQGGSVPDMSQTETQMWFYYCGRRYIDAGFEALHLGQVMLMDNNDPSHAGWLNMLGKLRAYAAKSARRHLVLCDAHSHGILENGVSLFDFNAFPLRPKPAADYPDNAYLEAGYVDSIYGKSAAGYTPSGWYADALPYIVEFDNWDAATDEITWFASRPEEYRNRWLKYAWEWVRANDWNGWVQPCVRRVAGGIPGTQRYCAHNRSALSPYGMHQEDMIKAIFAGADYNPLGLIVTRIPVTTANLYSSGMQSNDTLQTALAEGKATVSVDAVKIGSASDIADFGGLSSPGHAVIFPADGSGPTLNSGTLDIIFNDKYSGSRRLRDISYWVAPAINTRRFYNLEFYYSTTRNPTDFKLLLAVEDQGESGLAPGVGTRIRINLGNQISNLHTLRIRSVGCVEAPYLSATTEEIDVNLGS